MENYFNVKKRIGILGVGAIGSVITSELMKNTSIAVSCYSRTHKKSIKILSKNRKSEIPIEMHSSLSNQIELDWLVVCLKENHFSDAKDWFFKLITKNTKVAVIRNGLNLKEPLLKYTEEQNIIECIIDCPTQLKSDGFYESLNDPVIKIAKTNLSPKFKELFNESAVNLEYVNDFKTESWKKLIESSASGAILCLTGETCWIFKEENIQTLYAKLLKECISVARADGAEIEYSFADEMINKILAYPDDKSSSMLADKIKGNPIELGGKNGVISQIAQQRTIKTPINDLLVTLLTPVNKYCLADSK